MMTLLGILMSLTAVFLILIVLVQRGRGGGLAGALGGAGGQSAFGTKAGDTFTRVTIVTAAVWILLCMASITVAKNNASKLTSTEGGGRTSITLPGSSNDQGAADKPVDSTPATTPAGTSGGNSDSESNEEAQPAEGAAPAQDP